MASTFRKGCVCTGNVLDAKVKYRTGYVNAWRRPARHKHFAASWYHFMIWRPAALRVRRIDEVAWDEAVRGGLQGLRTLGATAIGDVRASVGERGSLRVDRSVSEPRPE
jgi:hypothetical protein